MTALRRTTTMTTLVVTVSDDAGHTGYGEAPQVWQVTGASVAGSQACVTEVFAPLLRGRDPDDLVGLCRAVRRAVAGNEAAKAAVDVALHDLAAHRLGVPWPACSAAPATRRPCAWPRTSRWPPAPPRSWPERPSRGSPTGSTYSR
ncbi:hypothetical protein ACFQX7_10695 [Luedemannella flava]